MKSLNELLNNYINNLNMKVQKKVSVPGVWVKLKEDVNDGDIISIADQGQVVAGEFGDRNVFKVELASGEEKNMSFNQTSMNYLIDAYGEETNRWVTKKAKVWIVKTNVAGKMRNIAYLTAPNWIEGPDGYYPPTNGGIDTGDIPVIEEE